MLHDVDARFEPGMLTVVLGPNGAGKSTLARALLGLVPSEGQVELDGEPLSKLPRRRLARLIAWLPQGQSIGWPVAADRLVALGRLPWLAPFARLSEADRQAVDLAMKRADVAHLKGRSVGALSGGERARVLLARALAVEAPVLVADEPLAALDPGHQLDVMELLRGQARRGGTVIAILHDLSLAERYADRLLLLHGGRVAAAGTAADVLTDRNLARVYGIRRVEGARGFDRLPRR